MNIRQHLMPTLFAAALALVVAVPATAQDETTDDIFGAPTEGYPVAIHEGSCGDAAADPVLELENNAVSIGVREEDPNIVGVAMTRPITETSGVLDVSFDELTDTAHVVAVHASPDQFGTLVACGQIAGVELEGELVVALVPVDDSGVSGIAIFDRDGSNLLRDDSVDLGDDQVYLTTFVIVPEKGEDTPIS